ncbi:hypothetical protein C8Q79DRAFT_1012844 [Trametes meyenii]|nr:hypothetical protein C8Q79DRAFT_1012844 [Trametes meyenii]
MTTHNRLRPVYRLAFDDVTQSSFGDSPPDSSDVLTWDADIPGATVKRFRFLNCDEFLNNQTLVIEEAQQHELLQRVRWCTVSYPRSSSYDAQLPPPSEFELDLVAQAERQLAHWESAASTAGGKPPEEYWRWLAIKDPAGSVSDEGLGSYYYASLAVLWEICTAVRTTWPDINHVWIDRLCARLGHPEERRWLLTGALPFLYRSSTDGRTVSRGHEQARFKNPSIVLPAGLGELAPLDKETPYMHCQWTLPEFLMASQSNSPIYVLFEWTREERLLHGIPDGPDREPGVRGFSRTQHSANGLNSVGASDYVRVVSPRAAMANLHVILRGFDKGEIVYCQYYGAASLPTQSGAPSLLNVVPLHADFLTPGISNSRLNQQIADDGTASMPDLKPVRLLLDLMKSLPLGNGDYTRFDVDQCMTNIFKAVFGRACDDGFIPIVVLVWLLSPYYHRDLGPNVYASLNLGRVGTSRDTVHGLYVLLHALIANTQCIRPRPFGWLSAGLMVSEPRCPEIPLFPAPPGRRPRFTTSDAQTARRSSGGTGWSTRPTNKTCMNSNAPVETIFRINYHMDVATHHNNIEITFSGSAVPLRELAEELDAQESGESITAYDGSRWVPCSESEHPDVYALAVAGMSGDVERGRCRRVLLLKPLCKPTAAAGAVSAAKSELIPAGISTWCDLSGVRGQHWWDMLWNDAYCDDGSPYYFQGSFLVTIDDPQSTPHALAGDGVHETDEGGQTWVTV